MSDDSQIGERRMTAAQASGGVSGEPIYALFERVIGLYGVSGTVLDFGAGQGALAIRLASMRLFRSIECVDLLTKPKTCPDSIHWHTCDLNSPTAIAGRSFDAIFSAELIEHLENPRALAREWFRLLKPGGWLLFSTPNNESLRSVLALICRGHYSAFGETSYPAHITALLRKDIERITREAGFEMIQIHSTDHGMLPKAKRLTWQGLSGNLLRGLRFSDNLLAVCRKPTKGDDRR